MRFNVQRTMESYCLNLVDDSGNGHQINGNLGTERADTSLS